MFLLSFYFVFGFFLFVFILWFSSYLKMPKRLARIRLAFSNVFWIETPRIFRKPISFSTFNLIPYSIFFYSQTNSLSNIRTENHTVFSQSITLFCCMYYVYQLLLYCSLLLFFFVYDEQRGECRGKTTQVRTL